MKSKGGAADSQTYRPRFVVRKRVVPPQWVAIVIWRQRETLLMRLGVSVSSGGGVAPSSEGPVEIGNVRVTEPLGNIYYWDGS